MEATVKSIGRGLSLPPANIKLHVCIEPDCFLSVAILGAKRQLLFLHFSRQLAGFEFCIAVSRPPAGTRQIAFDGSDKPFRLFDGRDQSSNLREASAFAWRYPVPGTVQDTPRQTVCVAAGDATGGGWLTSAVRI